MRRSYLYVILAISIVALALGLATAKRLPAHPPPCALLTFDHVSFLRLVRDSQTHAASRLQEVQSNATDPLRQLKIDYYQTKIASLAPVASLVAGQVALTGSTYACVDPQYQLLMFDMDYPTFQGLTIQAQARQVAVQLQEIRQTTVLQVLQVVLPPLATVLVALMALLKKDKPQGTKA